MLNRLIFGPSVPFNASNWKIMDFCTTKSVGCQTEIQEKEPNNHNTSFSAEYSKSINHPQSEEEGLQFDNYGSDDNYGSVINVDVDGVVSARNVTASTDVARTNDVTGNTKVTGNLIDSNADACDDATEEIENKGDLTGCDDVTYDVTSKSSKVQKILGIS